MAGKYTNLKGTRDFLPVQVERRRYILDTISKWFRNYGFLPIQTPSMERSETLLGKYGEEGDRLIFRVLNSGAKLKGADVEALQQDRLGAFANSLSEKAMRYDLTVPFARFVVQHQNDLDFPFKRYQIQNVWRGDRPQKGRYQEFTQCDADVVGSDSLIYEVEFVELFDRVLNELGLPDFTIRLNHRMILEGICRVLGISDRFKDVAIAIDKLDKVGPEGVAKELTERGVDPQAASRLMDLLASSGGGEIPKELVDLLSQDEVGAQGVKELSQVMGMSRVGGKAKVVFDATLARGLDYYTGTIYEVVVDQGIVGSICGGGRYANLTEHFGGRDLPGVGISFGADRIYDVMDELDLFGAVTTPGAQVMCLNFGEKELEFIWPIATSLRDRGISVEVYPEAAKLKKQMKSASNKGVRYVVMAGEQEMQEGKVTIKDMDEGTQESLTKEEIESWKP